MTPLHALTLDVKYPKKKVKVKILHTYKTNIATPHTVKTFQPC